MPIDPSAETVITGFDYVPDFAQGVVRDIRIRWALAEMGRPYRTKLLDAMSPRDPDYYDWQPFGQVPAFADRNVRLFESGAILLYLGEQDERLLPRDPTARWKVTSWLIAALNSVEPMLMQIVTLDIFKAEEPWAREARSSAVEFACQRLSRVDEALAESEWLAGNFSIADIMMVTVLRNIRHTDIVSGFPKLAAYQARGEERAAFRQALADQMAGFKAPAST